MNKQVLRAGIFALLMASATLVASAWTPRHYIADDRPPISLEKMFPSHFGEWEVDPSIVPVQPSPDLQKVLDETYDQTLSRTYRNARGDRVMMSIAYGRNQHQGMNTHRPEVCYPAQGLPISRPGERGTLGFDGFNIPVTRLVATNGSRNEPITYWVIVGDKITWFGRGHKMSTLRYGLQGKIPDGMLLRFSSIDSDDNEAFAVQARFVDDLLSTMKPADRVAVLGKAAASL
jgi:EpsI family protein